MRPRHRRDWSRWGRYCVCGLRWACPDRDGSSLEERFQANNRSDVWDRGLVASPHRNAVSAAYRRAVVR